MNNEYGLEKIFGAELKMLKEIDRICNKHGITYMLEAGTLIGAIREKGFIPWDDDVDISMTRENWERFKEIAPKELDPKMELLYPMELAQWNAFYDDMPRIIYLPSRRRDADADTAYFHEKLNHLWIDILIFDKLPDNKFSAFIMKSWQRLYYALLMGHRRELDWNKYTLIQKLGLKVFANLGKLFKVKTLLSRKEAHAITALNKDTKEYFCSNYPPEYYDMPIKTEWIKNTVKVPFEDTELAVAGDYEALLAVEYKDYKMLPPVEERKPSHGTELIEVDE